MLLVIPTLNEEDGIGVLLDKAKSLNLNCIVVDGGSTDDTQKIVKERGVRLFNAPSGKGKAFRYFVDNLHQIAPGETHILMIDGDGTYDLGEFKRLEELNSYDMVIGQRIPESGSFTSLRLFGNRLFNHVFSALYLRKTPDILSGFRLIKIDKLKSINLNYDNFELETELTAKFIRRGFSVKWVPVSYKKRGGKSKLKAFSDGFRILKCMLYLRFT